MQFFYTEQIENLPIEVFIKYKYLDSGELGSILNGLNLVFYRILKIQSRPSRSRKNDDVLYRFLEIESINTGHSIKIKFKEGWNPEIRFENNEIEVGVPKKLGVPAIILYLLLIGFQKSLTLSNQALDNQLKEYEIELKKIELFEKIQRLDSIKKTSVMKFSPQQFADSISESLIDNKNMYYIEINGVVVKGEDSSSKP